MGRVCRRQRKCRAAHDRSAFQHLDFQASHAEVRRRFEISGIGTEAVHEQSFLIDQLVRLAHDFAAQHEFPASTEKAASEILMSVVAVASHTHLDGEESTIVDGTWQGMKSLSKSLRTAIQPFGAQLESDQNVTRRSGVVLIKDEVNDGQHRVKTIGQLSLSLRKACALQAAL